MSTFRSRGRIALAALVLFLFAPGLFAQSGRSATTNADVAGPIRADASRPEPERVPAGDPDLGLLIIVGGIAFFILVAWIFSRTGDDGGRGPDRTLL